MTHHQTKNLTIAVTGHRFIPNEVRLRQSIRQVLENFLDTYPGYTFILLCPLAEGSDQVAARIALDMDSFELHVPLPMPVEEYLKDFISKSGQAAFYQLLSLAEKVHQIPPQKNHQEAYRELGHYLINHSDMLLAVWNGSFSQEVGGTSEVIRIASAAHKTIYWVYCPNQKPGEANNPVGQKQVGDIEVLLPENTNYNI